MVVKSFMNSNTSKKEFLYPTFIDSHLHVLGIGYVMSLVDLSEERSISEVIRLCIERKENHILIGRGWNQEHFFEKRNLTKHDLNQISRDIPVVLYRVCGHVLVVNDVFLERASLTKESPQVEGGTWDYETGLFTENAMHLITMHLPKPTKDDLKKYFLLSNQHLLKYGITDVASDDFSTFDIPYENVIEALKELYEEDLMQVRITEQVNLPRLSVFTDFIEKGYVNKQIHHKFRMGPLKLLADGSLGGMTAWLSKPYQNHTTRGNQTFTDEELFQLMDKACENKMDLAIHAIGDAAIKQVVKHLIVCIKKYPDFNHRHAIIHAQMANHRMIRKMKRFGIGAIIQPIFLNSDLAFIDQRIGKRKRQSYLFHTMLKKGLAVGFSTDAPVEHVNPFENMFVAMTRMSIREPHLESFLPHEVFTFEEAFACYTTKNLPYVYQKNKSDQDYFVVNDDLNLLTPAEIKDIKIRKVFIDGKQVY